MRVLLSAYACQPNVGSEPEVGWQRALHMLEFADEVWVLTRSNNRSVIEANSLSKANRLHFIYCDLSAWALRLKKQSWFRPIYFILWQWEAYLIASRHHRDKHFDCVFHVTFASLRSGSFMGRLGIPFVIGPVAGGERAPFRLRRSMPTHSKAGELLRDLGIIIQRYSPLTRSAFAAAERIYVTTTDSLQLVSPKWRFKTRVNLAIATNGGVTKYGQRPLPVSPRFVFAGRLLCWKGPHFAIRALAEARRTLPEATLTLIGSGPDERHLRDVAKRVNVTNAVDFVGQVPQKQLLDWLQSYTAFVFPSLHDSGGTVVLEALSKGLPIVCLDRGGPGVIVNESCGIVVPTAEANETQTVTNIAKAMITLASMPAAEYFRLSAGAVARANELSWTTLTESIIA